MDTSDGIVGTRWLPTSAWIGLGVVGLASVLLWWDPGREPPSEGPKPLAPTPTWPEVDTAPLATPDQDPLLPGAIRRLGRERLRQGSGPAVLSFSPDGAHLASVEALPFKGPRHHRLHIWDVATGREQRQFEADGHDTITELRFSADGRELSLFGTEHAAADQGLRATVRVLAVDTGKEVRRRERRPPQNAWEAISSDGTLLAWTNWPEGTIHVYDLVADRPLRSLDGQENEQPLAFTGNGTALLSVNFRLKTVHRWDLATEAAVANRLPSGVLRAAGGNPGWRQRISVSADGSRLIAWDRPITCWDLATGRILQTFDNPGPGWSSAAAVSMNGLVAAVGYTEGTVSWWDTRTGTLRARVAAFPGRIGCLQFSPDGTILASQQMDGGTLRLWDVASGRALHTPAGHQAAVTGLSIAPDGQTIATVGQDNTLRLWKTRTGEELSRVASASLGVAFAPDGKNLAMIDDGAAGERPAAFCLLEPGTGKLRRRFVSRRVFYFSTLAFSADGSKLFEGGEVNCLWEVATGRLLRAFPGSGIRPGAFSPDGTMLAIGAGFSDEGNRLPVAGRECIELWDPAGEHLLRRLGPAQWPAEGWRGFAVLAFSPDGKLLAAADQFENAAPSSPAFPDRRIRLYDVPTGQERGVLAGHAAPITALQFSPDGKTLVSASEDRTVRRWDVTSGQELQRFEGHRDGVTCVAYAPDGRTILSGSRDGTVLVWGVAQLAKP